MTTTSLESFVEELAGAQASEPMSVVTANLDHVQRMSRDAEFRDAYRRAAWRTLDGSPLVWLAMAMGVKGPRRISGSDLLPAICTAPQFARRSIVLLGGNPQSASLAAEKLREIPGNRDIAAVPMPYFESPNDERTRAAVEQLKNLQPDIVFVSLGSPKQELWLETWRSQLPASIYICSGAAIDFLSGYEERAPRWAQRLGCEWVWRLAQDPRRLWRRYLIDSCLALPFVARSLLRRSAPR